MSLKLDGFPHAFDCFNNSNRIFTSVCRWNLYVWSCIWQLQNGTFVDVKYMKWFIYVVLFFNILYKVIQINVLGLWLASQRSTLFYITDKILYESYWLSITFKWSQVSVLNKKKMKCSSAFIFDAAAVGVKSILTSYVVLSLLSASLLSSGPDTIFRSPDLLITAVIWEISTDKSRVGWVRRSYAISTTRIEILQSLTPKAKIEMR